MFIFCDCTDCKGKRFKGPCYLEVYYEGKSNEFLNEVRSKQREYKNLPSPTCIRINEECSSTVLRVSVV